jgi:hypothetical protein
VVPWRAQTPQAVQPGPLWKQKSTALYLSPPPLLRSFCVCLLLQYRDRWMHQKLWPLSSPARWNSQSDVLWRHTRSKTQPPHAQQRWNRRCVQSEQARPQRWLSPMATLRSGLASLLSISLRRRPMHFLPRRGLPKA